jgi:hypothetical protein
MYRIIAQNLSLAEAKARKDCDIVPELIKVTTEDKFVLVDVKYNSKGHCALYEYNPETGKLSLAQD